jgi:hypothetical protein
MEAGTVLHSVVDLRVPLENYASAREWVHGSQWRNCTNDLIQRLKYGDERLLPLEYLKIEIEKSMSAFHSTMQSFAPASVMADAGGSLAITANCVNLLKKLLSAEFLPLNWESHRQYEALMVASNAKFRPIQQSSVSNSSFTSINNSISGVEVKSKTNSKHIVCIFSVANVLSKGKISQCRKLNCPFPHYDKSLHTASWLKEWWKICRTKSFKLNQEIKKFLDDVLWKNHST